MRIELQFTFSEWLEWHRASIHPIHLTLLRIAEALLLPLSLLCGLSVVLVLLRLANVVTGVAAQLPAWLPIPFLILIAVIQIYLSRNPQLRRKSLRQTWQNEVADLRLTFEVHEKGVDYSSSAHSSNEIPWSEIDSVFQTKQFLVFRTTDEQVLLIPKSAFTSKDQMEEFLHLAHRKTVDERE